ncbi:hypothetical protein [Micromonospora cremea]|uniref:Uncharacterized protein n=1 Tax=Micromonospora cremea TaxID=709881 RepID=A0A1N6AW06_9ACTN|nr:hypothetical protein [Micromonospora cremea]SIN38219.1 hypothetical protein SAMN04489832_6263 [Micromonospora cremea]
MRRISLAMLTIAAIVLSVAPPAAAATPSTRITIEHRASELYPYDPTYEQEGPDYPATRVWGELRRCPAGVYNLSASLHQDGLPTVWATSGRGAGEITCDGGTESLSMSFYRTDPVLHSGRATVRFELHDAYVGTTLTETTRTVRIPR